MGKLSFMGSIEIHEMLKDFFNQISKNTEEQIHWFSGINKHEVPVYLEYIEMFKKAVISQRKTNPNIKPYLIFDGEPDEITQDLQENLNVTIIPYRVSFYDQLIKYYGNNHIASGAFLRCDIPIIVREILKLPIKFVLYTDNDVLFLDDISPISLLKPKFFSISSEFSKNRHTDINSGVIWINIDSMYEIYPQFRDFIVDNFQKFHTYDQDAFKLFFKKKMNKLDFRYNYKPYYGRRKDIKILHFHGPKPHHFKMCLDKTHPCMNLVNNFYYEMVEYYFQLSTE